jgi:hypothetical protein
MRATTIVILGSLIGACSGAPTQADTQRDGTSLVGKLGTIVQSVTLTPSSPTSGETVQIRSVVANGGSAAVVLDSRICGLDYGGSLELVWPPGIGKCGGYSSHGELAPGDSVVTYDLMRVDSPPGRHRLRVRHAISPEAWAELSVEVRAP